MSYFVRLPIFLGAPVTAKDEHLVSSPQIKDLILKIVKIFWLPSVC